MIICDEDTDHRSTSIVGSRAATLNPPSGSGPASRVQPSTSHLGSRGIMPVTILWSYKQGNRMGADRHGRAVELLPDSLRGEGDDVAL